MLNIYTWMKDCDELGEFIYQADDIKITSAVDSELMCRHCFCSVERSLDAIFAAAAAASVTFVAENSNHDQLKTTWDTRTLEWVHS